MARKLPRVLLLYTGGTLGMRFQDQGNGIPPLVSIPHLSPAKLKKRLFSRVPELNTLAQCDLDIIMNRDSSHIGPPDWLHLARKIRESWQDYDGIVLLHGTDTLAYTASALSFLLRPCLKPIVITGAQRPLSAVRTDARSNLVSAVEIAARGPRTLVRQVTVLFNDRLFQGNRVRKKSTTEYGAFESPHSPPLAWVGTSIHFNSAPPHSAAKLLKSPKSPKSPRLPKLEDRFESRILVVRVTPGFVADIVRRSLLPSVKGLILIIFPGGTATTHDPNFKNLLRTARERKIPIVLVTESISPYPSTQAFHLHYSAAESLRSEGLFSAGTMTPECAFVKTSYLLGQVPDSKQFAKLWALNLANEG